MAWERGLADKDGIGMMRLSLIQGGIVAQDSGGYVITATKILTDSIVLWIGLANE